MPAFSLIGKDVAAMKKLVENVLAIRRKKAEAEAAGPSQTVPDKVVSKQGRKRKAEMMEPEPMTKEKQLKTEMEFAHWIASSTHPLCCVDNRRMKKLFRSVNPSVSIP